MVDLTKEQRADLQRQADAGELGNSARLKQMDTVMKLQSRAFALELSIKLYSCTHPPSESFESVVRFIHKFMNETD